MGCDRTSRKEDILVITTMEKSVLEKIQDPVVENRYNMTSTSTQYPAPQHSGRVPNIRDPATSAYGAYPYQLYSKGEPLFGETTRQDLVGHQHTKTPLNEVFFSKANIDKLQEGIIEQVRMMSGGKYHIGPQNEDDLKLIMRSYYLTYAKNNASDVANELQDLNGRVIGYASGKVYSEVDFHMFYLKDLEEFAPAIANPMNPHVYGTRTGELKSFF